MKFILILEEAAMAAFGLYMLSFFNLGLSTWIWALLFFSPDIGMVGYRIFGYGLKYSDSFQHTHLGRAKIK
jgi:hypothetical protein